MNTHLTDARTWVVKHAKEIIERSKKNGNDQIILKMGYGPSGEPHLGTVTELIRTCMIAKTLRQMQNLPVVVISFCDDLDGMRKIPPGHNELEGYIGAPLSRIPYKNHNFAENNIQKLQAWIHEFGYTAYDYRPTRDNPFAINHILKRTEDIILIRGSDMYGSGSYNQYLKQILINYDKILDIIIPTLGEVRQATYSPFMPIINNVVMQEGVQGYYPETNEIMFGNQRIKVEYDNCKLQWKVDFAMQWMALQVDYEMGGKDIGIGTNPISKAILETLGYNAPITPMYEMFLADDGSKMSKTKGNGLSLSQMFKYCGPEVISHFMFLNPESAKVISIQKIPSYIDAFVKDLCDYNLNPHAENPLWYLQHNSLENPHFNASTMLNLLEGLNPLHSDVMINFLQEKRDLKLNYLDLQIIKRMYDFFQEAYSKPVFEPANNDFRTYMLTFIPFLSEDAEAMQQKLYELGNEAVNHGFVKDLRSWFRMIYKSLLGREQGPRLGSFFALYGKEKSAELIKNRLGF